jgi:hypothetical protein
MSAPGRPKRELIPLGGKARSAKGAHISEVGELTWRRRRTLGLLACVVLAPHAALAQDSRATMVQRVAREWLALVDKQDGEASWKAAGTRLQDSVTLPVWTETVRRERESRGALLQRAVTATTFTDSIKGLPPGGSYAVVTFRSSFANQTDSGEEVILEVGAGYAWRVIGYAISGT